MKELERVKLKISNSGEPNPNLPCEIYGEAETNDAGEVRLFLNLRNDGDRIAVIKGDDIHAFSVPDGYELVTYFEGMETIRILPGYEREICLVVMGQPTGYLTVSIDDSRDMKPEQLIECNIIEGHEL